MTANPWLLAAVPIIGVLAGFINTLAGSGSLITLPLLIHFGLPATIANATNRVGVVMQNIVAVATFRRQGKLDVRGTSLIIGPAIAGSLLGATLAADLDEVLMRRIIGGLMLVMLAVLVVKPERWIASAEQPRQPRAWVEVPVFFALGVYGGFIQAGIGIFLLSALVLSAGFNLVAANVVKNWIVLIITAVALVIFIGNGQINWTLGILLALGQMVGGWIAARMAIKHGAEFVRWTVIVIVALSAVALFTGIGQ